MQNTFLEYRTYDQLLAEIQTDFKNYDLESFINPQEFIKVAKRCNKELGLRIFKTNECVLDVENGKAKLPNNFQVLNFAFMLSSHYVIEPVISGTHVESVNLGPVYNPGPPEVIDLCAPDPQPVVPQECPSCCVPYTSCSCNVVNVSLDCKGNNIALIQNFKYHTRKWTQVAPIRIINSPDFVDFDCPNKTWQAPNTAYLRDRFIFPSFKTGKLYINYQGMMEDEEGNLLVPDHDILNEFYEYAVKQRVLENMIMNGENINGNQLQIIEARFKAARNNAYSLVNTPNFNELRQIWEVNRKAQYHNYYNMFKSY